MSELKAEIVMLSDVLRNVVTWLCISEDTAEGDSPSWLCGNDGLPASSTDGFSGMQKNQVDVGWSRRRWQNKVCCVFLLSCECAFTRKFCLGDPKHTMHFSSRLKQALGVRALCDF